MAGLDGWHCDGDFFVHFLDSPEQGLLVIPLWSDIETKGGGTAVCGDGIKHIAQHLVLYPDSLYLNSKSNCLCSISILKVQHRG